ncbi:OpgC domain-containing protein [Janibacter sp. G1551]|uniref:OpgC domain-containing protein n=1 Tax=Janibacter sp. G1551 TaxID=3420440 RepID=UPI003D019C8F
MSPVRHCASMPHRWSSGVAALAVLLIALALGAGPAAAGSARIEKTADGPLIGIELNWNADSAARFTERLGVTPALYDVPLHLPLTGESSIGLRDTAAQAAEQGAGLIITVNPHAGLSGYEDRAAQGVARAIARVTRGVTGPVLVVFGPQMNTPWVAWGLQPTAYSHAFRLTARALSREAPRAQLVWSPQTRTGYPFAPDASSPAVASQPAAGTDAALDTNGDQAFTGLDDAYAPYYPGDDDVDWVGLVATYDPVVDPGETTPAPPGGLAREMLGQDSGTDPNGFYVNYSVARDKPMMLDSGAAFRPGGGGPAEIEVKANWWDQVLRLPDEGYDRLDAAVWHEVSTVDSAGRYVDRRVGSSPALASTFRSKAAEHHWVTGPVTEPARIAEGRTKGVTLTRDHSWVVVGIAAIVLAGLWLLRRTSARSLAYVEGGRRDDRIDFLRGMAIIFVVVDHLGLTSLFHNLTQEAIGIVSGAELFVALAGVILGLVSRPRMAVGMFEAVDRGWARARRLYLWALFLPLTVFALSHLPWLDTSAVTTYSAPNPGPATTASGPGAYDLFSGLDGLLDFPADPAVVPRLLGLQFGPWQFNILGLYVILLLVSPFVLQAMQVGRSRLVVALSLAFYGLSQVTDVRLLPFQSDDAFPILAWQVLFVLGLAAGFHSHELRAFLGSGRGRVVLVLCTVLATALMLMSWNNPFLSTPYDVRLSLIPTDVFNAIYQDWFARTRLRPGRLVNVIVLLVSAYALLTILWKPINACLGWLLVPLGRSTLYVFIVHVFIIIIVVNMPLISFGSLWLNTAAYVVIILILWIMVKKKVLARVIPT